MSLSSVRSETALRSRLFSSSRSFRRFTCSVFNPPNSCPTDNTSPRSPRSDGLHPPCSGPARPEHRPAAASRRSLQACIASLPLQSSWISKTYLKSDHFNGGGSECPAVCGNCLVELALPSQRIPEVERSLSQVWLDADRPAICGNRLVKLALPKQRIAEVGMSLSEVGLDRDRLAICRDRLVGLTLAHERITKVAMGVSHAWVVNANGLSI